MSKKIMKNASLGKHVASNISSSTEPEELSDPDRFSEQGDAVKNSASQTVSQDTVSLPAQKQTTTALQDTPEADFVGFEPSFDAFKKTKKHRGGKFLKVIGIFFASIFGLLLVVYLVGCVFFIDRFWPNTTMGNYDLSMKSLSEAESVLSAGVADYQLRVSGQNFSLNISAREAGLSLDAPTVLSQAVKGVKPWLWPFEILKGHDVSESLTASYNKSGIEEIVRAEVDKINATATQPTDATLAFDDTTQFFRIVSEDPGTALDLDAILEVLDASLAKVDKVAQITEQQLVQPKVRESNSLLKAARNSANAFLVTDVTFTLGGSPVVILGPAAVASWVVLGEDLSVTFDEAAFNGWIDGVIAGCNTVGAERTYTRPDGKAVTVAGGTYGWEIDGETFRILARDAFFAGQKGTVEIPAVSTGNGFDAIGGRDWGLRYCDIDLTEQHARFYDEAGALVWESDIISGTPNGYRDTPTGAYVLNAKQSPSKLVGQILPGTDKPEYETWVDYWMPFVGNSVGLHDATWQPGFGGSMYATGYGSHGCVNLPYSAAETLYGIIVEGDPVICHW